MSDENMRRFESFIRAWELSRSESRLASVCIAGDGSHRIESMLPAWLGPDEQPTRMSGVLMRTAVVIDRRSVRVVFIGKPRDECV
jgi:hypothetical protein